MPRAIAQRAGVYGGLLPAAIVAEPPRVWCEDHGALSLLGEWLEVHYVLDFGYSVGGVECCLLIPRAEL